MRKILLALNSELESLPPVMTLIDVLSERYQIDILIPYPNKNLKKYYAEKGVHCICPYYYHPTKSPLINTILRHSYLNFKFFWSARNLIKKEKYDLIWIASAKTAILLSNLIRKQKYFITLYELYDNFPKIIKKLSIPIKNAQKTFVCEENRAWIYRVWFNLKKTPIVIPNKPLTLPPVSPNKNLVQTIEKLKSTGKKILIYQGYIGEDRNIDTLCKAIGESGKYTLVLMGPKSTYADNLSSKYEFVKYIGYFAPPAHLAISSQADVGIVTYNPVSLNTIYCAPNKIWEYAAYELPMLANNVPGLTTTVGRSGAGLCIDMEDPEEIKSALNTISEQYEALKKKSKDFYESVDIKKTIIESVEGYFAECK